MQIGQTSKNAQITHFKELIYPQMIIRVQIILQKKALGAHLRNIIYLPYLILYLLH